MKNREKSKKAPERIKKSTITRLSTDQMSRVYGGEGGGFVPPDTTSNTCEEVEVEKKVIIITGSQMCS